MSTPPDVHALSGAYALDAVDDDERALVEAHLAGCDFCVEEVAGLRAAAAMLSRTGAQEPPASLRSAVLARVATTPQLPPIGIVRDLPDRGLPGHRQPAHRQPAHARARADRRTDGPWGSAGPAAGEGRGRRPRTHKPRWLRPVTAAAAAVAVIVAALGFTAADRQQRLDDERRRADQLGALASAALARSAPVRLDGGGSLVIVAVDDSALIAARDLPALTAGRVYQFWFIGPGGARSAGTADGRAVAVDRLLTGVGDARSIAVTVEAAGGSAQPTMQPLVNAPVRT